MKKIFVFDMAPERFQTQNTAIGGKLTDYDSSFQQDSKIEAFTYSINPPRSKSTNQKEVYENCVRNFQQIFRDFNELINLVLQNPKDEIGLLINDLSIYLHLGSYIPFLKILKSPTTVFINSYFGEKLAHDYDSNISWRERIVVQALSNHFDYPIHLVK